jgi:hypothetical protein
VGLRSMYLARWAPDELALVARGPCATLEDDECPVARVGVGRGPNQVLRAVLGARLGSCWPLRLRP